MSLITRMGRVAKWIGLSTMVPTVQWYWNSVLESFTGAWQRNVTVDSEDQLLRSSAIYACVTGISTDIAKNRIMLCQDNDGIWEEIKAFSPYKPVLKKPNHYQNRILFVEQWILSKLLHGNAYVLKVENNNRIVQQMYVLDPRRVVTKVAPSGDVYYELKKDDLSGLDIERTVPASVIIHDRMPCLWHPLVGVSPLYACALAGTVGNKIQNKAIDFFQNRALPGGVITAPGSITEEVAKRIKEAFEKNYSGANVGRLAVLGDGLEFKLMEMTAEASQLAEQFKMSVEDIARAFHYPIFKLGGPLPAYAGNVNALITSYYTDCLQTLIEKLEIALDEGMGLSAGMHTQVDLDNLMRMDTASLYETNSKGVSGGWMAPNEARFRANYGPTQGGDAPYLQQQNFSLEALAKRDSKEDPFAKDSTKTTDNENNQEELKVFFGSYLRKDSAA